LKILNRALKRVFGWMRRRMVLFRVNLSGYVFKEVHAFDMYSKKKEV